MHYHPITLRHRIIALLLALAMLCTVLPFAVLADELDEGQESSEQVTEVETEEETQEVESEEVASEEEESEEEESEEDSTVPEVVEGEDDTEKVASEEAEPEEEESEETESEEDKSKEDESEEVESEEVESEEVESEEVASEEDKSEDETEDETEDKTEDEAVSVPLFTSFSMATTFSTTTTASETVSLKTNISKEMFVETAEPSFTFMMLGLFSTQVYDVNYYVKVGSDGTWSAAFTETSYTYDAFTTGEYGTQEIWFKCVEDEGTEDEETSPEVKITLYYYNDTDTVAADGTHQIYSYQQLKDVISTASGTYSIALMNDIYVYSTDLTSGALDPEEIKASYANQIINCEPVINFNGNGYTIYATDYVDADALSASVVVLKVGAYAYSADKTIQNLTIDCGDAVSGIWVGAYDATLDGVTIENVSSDGYALKYGFLGDVTLAGAVSIDSAIRTSTDSYLYNKTSAAVTMSIDGTEVTIAAGEEYPEQPVFELGNYWGSTIYYSCDTLDAAITAANGAYSEYYFYYNKTDAVEPATVALTGVMYPNAVNMTFACDAGEYGITIADDGWLEVIDGNISAGDGQSFLVQSGGTLYLWDSAQVDGITVESDGTLYLCDWSIYGYYLTYSNVVLEKGAIVTNDSTSTTYTVPYDGKTVAVPAGTTYIAGTQLVTCVDGLYYTAATAPSTATYVASIGTVTYTSLADALAAATSGDSITLQADASLTATATLASGASLTIAEGLSVTVSSGIFYNYGTLTNNGSLVANSLFVDYGTIEGSGSITAPSTSTTTSGKTWLYGSIFNTVGNALTGDTVDLLMDVTITSDLWIKKSITLDLGGHTISASAATYSTIMINVSTIDVVIQNGTVETSAGSAAIWVNSANTVALENLTLAYQDGTWGLLIVSGAVTVSNCDISAKYCGVQMNYGGSVLIENSAITGEDRGISIISASTAAAPSVTIGTSAADTSVITGYYGIYIGGAYGNGVDAADVADGTIPQLIINGGTIGSENSMNAIIGNGSSDYTYIEINGGTLTGGLNCAISHPQTGDLIITGGSIQGQYGIFYCGNGTLDISGGSITGTTTSTVNPFKDSADSDGAIAEAGAAVVIASRGSGYQDSGRTITVNISGGTLTSVANEVILVLRMSKVDDVWVFDDDTSLSSALEALNITGGVFIGDIFAVDAAAEDAIVISSGEYSTAPSDAWVIDGYCVSSTTNANGYWYITQKVVEDWLDDVTDLTADIFTDGTATAEQTQTVYDTAAALSEIDSDALAADEAVVEAINAFESTFIAAVNADERGSGDIEVAGTEPEIPEALVDTEDAMPEQTITPEGLAVAVFGNSLPEEGTTVTLTLDVAQVESTDESVAFAFTAQPYQTVEDAYGNETTSKISNSSISSPVTFNVYLPESFTADYAKVVHYKTGGGSETFYLPVLTEEATEDGEANKRYIRITVTGFSTFNVSEYTPTVADTSTSTTTTTTTTTTTASSTAMYGVALSYEGVGTITPDGSDWGGVVYIATDSMLTFVFTPSAGYQVTDVFVNGVSVGAVGYYTVAYPTYYQTLHVIFGTSGHTNPQTGLSTSTSAGSTVILFAQRKKRLAVVDCTTPDQDEE